MIISKDKTKCMLFRPPHLPNFELDVLIDGHKIEQVHEFKYLGLWMDSHLEWNSHYVKVYKTAMSRVKLLSRYKKFFDKNKLMSFCNALVISLIDYCLPIWGQICATKLAKVEKILVRMLEDIIVCKRILPCEKFDYFERYNLLSVSERKDLYFVSFIYKHLLCDSQLRNSLAGTFDLRNNIKSLRHSRDLEKPRLNTVFAQKSFFYYTVNLWNSLPPHIPKSKNFNHFDKAVREYLVKRRSNMFQV